MEDMASGRTTVVLTEEERQALRRASKAEGLSQSELIRKGIRTVTSSYRKRLRPLVGWLKLSRAERAAVVADRVGDPDD